jgi:hypothetical protein
MNYPLFLLLLISQVFIQKAQENQQTQNQNFSADSYLASDCKGNYIWAGAMNLAWNELNDNILHGKLKLNTSDKIALQMVEKLNNPVFTKNDLDENSYYIKSGYGQKTVTIINKESRKKFPNKSFEDLDLQLAETDIISYAYFLKEVAYKNTFEKGNTTFNDIKVKGFFASNKMQKENVSVLKYESDDKFIISLVLKDNNDQMILAKGYPRNFLQKLINEINEYGKKELSTIKSSDVFSAPSISLSHFREYNELIYQSLLNKGFESYQIRKMFENIKFDMDEKGARVENEAVIVLAKSIQFDDEKPRKFIMDKPYWIIMKRKDSPNPYFILGINNTNLMSEL